MQLFFSDNINNHFTLSSEESKHIIKVLRKKEGDIIHFTDGKGNLLVSEIITSHIKKTQVRIIEKISKEKKHNYYLHIAISPTKNIDRFEWFLEKSCEIGIDEITPLICDRSERKFIKLHRCKKILLSAMKQSLKYNLPKLNEPIPFLNFINEKHKEQKFIAHCQNETKINLKNQKIEKNILILIGPEGDFSQNEINIAISNKFTPISFGDSRLRTETAGVLATSLINLKN